jgi:hypothetical protein
MRTIVKNIPVRDPKTKSVIQIDVDVEIDVYGMAAQLGQKAYLNKSGKSFALEGLITVSVRRQPGSEG